MQKNDIVIENTKDGTTMEKGKRRKYTPEEKAEAVALAEEIGGTEAANQLNIPEGTLYGWLLRAQKGTLVTEEIPMKPIAATDETERLREELKAIKLQQKLDKAKFEKLEKESKIKDDVIDFFVNRQKK